MTESILQTIKKMLGYSEDYTDFDTDIMIHINSAIMKIAQIKKGSFNLIRVTSQEQLWSELIQNEVNFDSVKDYIFISVKLVFDPPPSSKACEMLEKELDELEWRLCVQSDYNSEVTQ